VAPGGHRPSDRLVREFGSPHQQPADAVGRSRAAVSNLLSLLELADEVKTLVEHRQLEMGHARALLGLPQARQQSEVGALVARKGLSVRETEALVKRMLAHGDKANRKRRGDEPGKRGRKWRAPPRNGPNQAAAPPPAGGWGGAGQWKAGMPHWKKSESIHGKGRKHWGLLCGTRRAAR